MVAIAAERLAPLVAEIASPASIVFGVLALEYPSSMVRPLPGPESSADGRLVQIDGDVLARWRSVELLIAEPPDSVTYRMVRGPCAQLERRFHLRERDGHTRVLAEGTWTPGGVFGRLNGHRQVIQATRALLATVQQEAERLARSRLVARQAPVVAFGEEASDPEDLQRRLLLAVEQQELAEWREVGHGAGTARLAVSLAQALRLPDDLCACASLAGALHDVGKIRIEPHLFDRSGTLSAAGQRRLEEHPRLGAALVLPFAASDLLVSAIRHHHERWDGNGYPDGLAGTASPLVARIVGVAEAVDAMQRPLPERRGRSTEEVALLLERHAGRQWDPDLAHRMAALIGGSSVPAPTG